MPFRTQSYQPASPSSGAHLWDSEDSTLSNVFDLLDRPGQAVRGAIKGGYDDNESLLGGAWKGLSGQKKVYGTDLLSDAGMKDAGWGRSALGFGVDLLTDPLTFLPAGAIGKVARATGVTALAKGAGKLAKTGVHAAEAASPTVATVAGHTRSAVEGAKKSFMPGYGLDPGYRDMRRLHDAAARSNAEKVAEKIVEVSKGYDPTVRRAALIWLEKGGRMAPDLPGGVKLVQKDPNVLPEVAELGTKYKALLGDIFDREATEGIQDAAAKIEQYAPRVFGKKAKEGLFYEGAGRTVSAKNPFASKRELPSIDEALKKGMEPDAAIAVNARLRTGEKSIRSAQFLKDAAAKYGKKVEREVKEGGVEGGFKRGAMPDGFKSVFSKAENPLGDARFFQQTITLADGTTAKLRDLALPEKIADDLHKSFLRGAKEHGTATKLALGALDKTNQLFRAGATYLRPGFHATNLQGNVWNMGLSGMNPASSVMGTAKQARGLWKGASVVPDAGIAGKSKEEILAAIDKFNISSPQSTFAGMDDIEGVPQKILEKLDGVQKTGLLGKYARGMRKLGSSIEGGSKEALFLHELKAGKSVEDAAATVNKYLFDYADLTNVEKEIRKFVPFYTWSRKNVPLQAQELARTPWKFAAPGKFKHGVEDITGKNRVAEGDRPEYLREDEAIQLPWQKKGGATYFSPYLPYKDLNMLQANPLRLLQQEGMAMLGPAAKLPLEAVLNKDMLTWGDLYDKDLGYTGTTKGAKWLGGLPLPVALKHLTEGIVPAIPAAGRIATGAGQAALGDPAGGSAALLSQLLGIRPTVRDRAGVKRDKDFNRTAKKTAAGRAKKQAKTNRQFFGGETPDERAKRLASEMFD